MSAWVPEHDKRQSKASAKVTDAANTSKPGLKSHQAARDLADSEATRILTSKSTAVKKTPTGTCPATTTTISQSTTAKRKQPASILDVEDEDSHVLDVEDEDSHVLPKGQLEHSFLIAFSHFSQLQPQKNLVLCYLTMK